MASLDFVKVLDPRVNSPESKTYLCNVGNKNVSMLRVSAETISDTNLKFTAKPPSRSSYMNRRLLVEYQITLTFPNDVSALLDAGTFHGFRAYPLSSCATSLIVGLNNEQISVPLRDISSDPKVMTHF